MEIANFFPGTVQQTRVKKKNLKGKYTYHDLFSNRL